MLKACSEFRNKIKKTECGGKEKTKTKLLNINVLEQRGRKSEKLEKLPTEFIDYMRLN